MQREIKFRAWIPKTKEMLYHGSRMDLWGYWWLVTGGLENAIPMQYTGLHNKNGKEIYEGDIVQFRFANLKELMIAKAHWALTGWGLLGIGRCSRCGWFKDKYLWDVKCGIIGNIYENPELLE